MSVQVEALGIQDQIAQAYSKYTDEDKKLLDKAGLLFKGEVEVKLNNSFRKIRARYILLKGVNYKKMVKRSSDGRTFKQVEDESQNYSSKPVIVSIVADRSNKIAGNWKNGLTPDEVSLAMGRFNLEEYYTNRRLDGRNYHETRITVMADQIYDMAIPSQMAEFKVLLANTMIAVNEDFAKMEGRTHYWYKKEDRVKNIQTKAQKARRLMDLLKSMTDVEKAMAMIVSLYQAEKNIPNGYSISDLAAELDHLILEDPNRLHNVIGNEVPVYTQLVLIHAKQLNLLVQNGEDNYYYYPAPYGKEPKLFSKNGLDAAATLVTQKGQDLIASIKEKMKGSSSPVENKWKMISSKELKSKPENTSKYSVEAIDIAQEFMLKRMAADLDVKFAANIGVDTLRKRVKEAFLKNSK